VPRPPTHATPDTTTTRPGYRLTHATRRAAQVCGYVQGKMEELNLVLLWAKKLHALEVEHAKDISKSCKELMAKMPPERRHSVGELLGAAYRHVELEEDARRGEVVVGRESEPDLEAVPLASTWLGVAGWSKWPSWRGHSGPPRAHQATSGGLRLLSALVRRGPAPQTSPRGRSLPARGGAS